MCDLAQSSGQWCPFSAAVLRYHACVSVTLKHDRGTLITWEVPEVIETLQAHNIQHQHQNQAAEFKALKLRVSREVQPYRHRIEALAARKQAGRQGAVVFGPAYHLSGRQRQAAGGVRVVNSPRERQNHIPSLALTKWRERLADGHQRISVRQAAPTGHPAAASPKHREQTPAPTSHRIVCRHR